MASITISADGTEQKVALEGATITLGRGLESDVRLKDIKASRRHCQIVKTAAGYECVDLSSGNGTFVNGVQIKQQALNPGDKIQIGSTTITFHSGAAPAAKPAAPARASSGATAVTAAAKTAVGPKVQTSQLPVAATRKITQRAEAAKPATSAGRPATQSMPKPTTQAVAKVGTQAVPKAGGAPTTSASRTASGTFKKTGRVPGTTRSMQKASATAQFKKEAAKKKVNPIAAILIGIGVIFVGVVVAILMGGSGNQAELLQQRYDKLMAEGAKFEEMGKSDEAIGKYRQALKEIEGSERFKRHAIDIKARIKTIEDEKKIMAEAGQEFEKLRKKFETMKDEQAQALYTEAKQFEERVKNVQPPFDWLPELKVIIERINKVIETNIAISKREDFQVMRNEITDKYKLGKRSEADFSGALREWNTYLAKGSISSENKTKAEGAVRAVNQQAREELRVIENRVKRMVENGEKQAAADELKKHRARFELTELKPDFEKLLIEIDK